MPIHYRIDERADVVTVTAEGVVSQDEDLACFTGMLGDPAYRPGMGLLLDYRQRRSVATTEQVQQFVDAGAKLREAFGDSRCAIVVSEDVAFGMGRVYAALSEDSFIRTGVFRDIEEATGWLGETARVAPA